jgi:hypothetical protein
VGYVYLRPPPSGFTHTNGKLLGESTLPCSARSSCNCRDMVPMYHRILINLWDLPLVPPIFSSRPFDIYVAALTFSPQRHDLVISRRTLRGFSGLRVRAEAAFRRLS